MEVGTGRTEWEGRRASRTKRRCAERVWEVWTSCVGGGGRGERLRCLRRPPFLEDGAPVPSKADISACCWLFHSRATRASQPRTLRRSLSHSFLICPTDPPPAAARRAAARPRVHARTPRPESADIPPPPLPEHALNLDFTFDLAGVPLPEPEPVAEGEEEPEPPKPPLEGTYFVLKLPSAFNEDGTVPEGTAYTDHELKHPQTGEDRCPESSSVELTITHQFIRWLVVESQGVLPLSLWKRAVSTVPRTRRSARFPSMRAASSLASCARPAVTRRSGRRRLLLRARRFRAGDDATRQ